MHRGIREPPERILIVRDEVRGEECVVLRPYCVSTQSTVGPSSSNPLQILQASRSAHRVPGAAAASGMTASAAISSMSSGRYSATTCTSVLVGGAWGGR